MALVFGGGRALVLTRMTHAVPLLVSVVSQVAVYLINTVVAQERAKQMGVQM